MILDGVGCLGVEGVEGLVVRFNFGFSRTKTTRNVVMGFDSGTFSKKQSSKQLKI